MFKVFSSLLIDSTMINAVFSFFSKSGTIWNTGENIIVIRSCSNPENRQKHEKRDKIHRNPRENRENLMDSIDYTIFRSVERLG